MGPHATNDGQLTTDQYSDGHDGTAGEREPEFSTLPRDFIRRHHATSTWEKVSLRNLKRRIERLKNGAGFELIAGAAKGDGSWPGPLSCP